MQILPFNPGIRRHTRLAAAVAVAAALASGLAACDSAHSKAADGVAAAPSIAVATLAPQDIVETQEFSGRMEAIEQVEIRARVGGFITAINFKPGSAVRKGQVLFVIDQCPYQAELNRAEAAATAARAKADLAKIELLRAEKLLADKAIAQRELDESAAGFKELDAGARAAQAVYEAARVNLAYTQVLAPIDGRVGKAEITLGNLIDPSAILTSVVSIERIYASFDGDEDTYLRVGAQVHQGRAVAVRVGLANETGFPHEGKLEFIDNQLDPKTGSVRMRAVFANDGQLLAPGLFARVQLDGGEGAAAHTRALMINERAIGTDQSHKFVYVVDAANKAQYREVTLGATIAGQRIVRSGLKAGERIVVDGLQRVQPGAAITPRGVAMTFDPAAKIDASTDVKPDAKSVVKEAA